MHECVFCKIVCGELPGRKIFEDEHSLVILDIANDVDGHMLAIPKQHCSSLLDCNEVTLWYLMSAVKKVADYCVQNCGFNGVNLLNASGACAGQSVSHFHIHIIPRKEGDGLDAWPIFPGAKTDLDVMHERLKMI